MNRYGKVFEILDGLEPVRRICIALLDDNIASVEDLKGMGWFAHPAVVAFRTSVEELTHNDESEIAKLRRECRILWPMGTPGITEGPGLQLVEEDQPGEFLLNAYKHLRAGLISEVTALQIACLIKAEEQDSAEVKTSDVTSLLRAAGYKVPNPAALIRSLADRAEPAIEVLEEKTGPRQELQFRLLPAVADDLRKRILGSEANVA